MLNSVSEVWNFGNFNDLSKSHQYQWMGVCVTTVTSVFKGLPLGSVLLSAGSLV